MQINKIYIYSNTNKYNNRTSFEGLNLRPNFLYQARNAKAKMINTYCLDIQNLTGIPSFEIFQFTKESSSNKLSFLKQMAKLYNGSNFYKINDQKESPQYIIDIFKFIVNPRKEHFNILNKTNAPFESLYSLFKLANDKKSISFAENIQNNILDGSDKSLKIISDLLKSKNKNLYMKKIGDYTSYLKLNKDNENAVKKLDELILEGKYITSQYDKNYAINTLMQISGIKIHFEKYYDYLENNYSKEGEKFLKLFFEKYATNAKKISENNISDILQMYKSSTNKNIITRLNILNKFKNPNESLNSLETQSMKTLFEKIDNDKNSAKFVHKILGDNIKISQIEELNEILDIVPSKKAEIFHKNIARIIKYTDRSERAEALKNEIENPFFITRRYAQVLNDSIKAGFTKKESVFDKLIKSIENKINIIRYNKLSAPVSNSIHIQSTPVLNTQIESVKTEQVKITPAKIELKRTFKESRDAKKLRVQSDINEIIKQKLGQKTFERQNEKYKNGALVMRLKLLPEIFDSIKHTRKMQKLKGLRPNIENKDAIKLYSRINGKNKKLVNYMLKQTDDSGNRVYSIKDILQRLDLIESKITKLKTAKGKDFRAQDVKEICALEYETVYAQYGKLRRHKKVA